MIYGVITKIENFMGIKKINNFILLPDSLYIYS